MGRWEDGKMGRWEDGKMGRFICSFNLSELIYSRLQINEIQNQN
jgi:hypothetical protein